MEGWGSRPGGRGQDGGRNCGRGRGRVAFSGVGEGGGGRKSCSSGPACVRASLCVCVCVRVFFFPSRVLTKHRFNDAESGCHLSSALMATPATVTTGC